MTRYRHYAAREQQRGFGTMGFLAGILAVLALAGITYAITSSDARLALASDQQAALRNADRLIAQFAQAHGRYPCPAATVNGSEDCSIKGKGWLPTMTLLPGTASLASWLPLKYVVYRGIGTNTDPDLAATTDAYVPRLPDGTSIADDIREHPGSAMLPAGASSAYPTILSNLDFCNKLVSLRPSLDPWTALGVGTSPPSAARAYVLPDSGSTPRQVAYAIAVSGGTNGFGTTGFGGLNVDTGAGMESPLAVIGANYGDQVLAVSVPSASRRMQCSQPVESVDMLATALSLEDDNANTKSGLSSALGVANSLIDLVLAEDAIFAQMRINQVAIAGYKAKDADATAAIEALSLFTLPQAITDQTGAAELRAAAAATVNATAQALVVAADALYQSQYRDLLDRTNQANVWHGGLNILKDADEVGTTAPIELP